MNDVKKAVKNFNFSSKTTLGIVLGVAVLLVDSLELYGGQPLPDAVHRIAMGVALLITALGLADAANLEKMNLIDRIKSLVMSSPVIGAGLEILNAFLNSIPEMANLLPAGLFNALHALSAALIALGLRQKIGEARLNSAPVPAELSAKHQAFTL